MSRSRIAPMEADNMPSSRRRPPDEEPPTQTNTPSPPATEPGTDLAGRPASSWRFSEQTAAGQSSDGAAEQSTVVRLPPVNREPTRSLQVDVPVTLHRELKVISLETEMPLKELVVMAVKALVADYRRSEG